MSLTAYRFTSGVPSDYGTPGTMPLNGPEPGGGVGIMSAGDVDLGTTPGYGSPLEYARPGHAGAEIPLFARDWYDRLHISEALLALGNVIGQQVRAVNIWNAYRRVQNLAGIAADNTEGITLTGQPAPPLAFAPLQEREYTVTISTSGPATINASFTWDFAPYDLVLEITGSRITAWTFAPDWTRGILERLEWKTDVLTSYNAKEQRRALRLSPRKRYEFDAFFQGQERRYAEAVIWGWGARNWALPIWPDGQQLEADLAAEATEIPIDTTTRDFSEGGFAILMQDAFTYEIVEVATFTTALLTLTRGTTAAWPAGTRIYPARLARLSDRVRLPRWDGQASYLRAAFDIEGTVDYTADAGAVTYRDNPVLTSKPNWTGGFDIELMRKIAEIDNLTGARAYEDESGMPQSLQRMRWTWTSRAEQDAYRQLLYALRGRCTGIWIPTWEDDLRVVALIGAASQTIDVEWTGYTLQIGDSPNRKDIRIELTDGSVFYRRIVSAQEIDQGTERLGIDAPLGVEVAAEDVLQVSYMAGCRLDADAVELAHWTGEVCESATTWRSLNHDV